jgi:hypothetical protein
LPALRQGVNCVRQVRARAFDMMRYNLLAFG